jgi:hypothetical protein
VDGTAPVAHARFQAKSLSLVDETINLRGTVLRHIDCRGHGDESNATTLEKFFRFKLWFELAQVVVAIAGTSTCP